MPSFSQNKRPNNSSAISARAPQHVNKRSLPKTRLEFRINTRDTCHSRLVLAWNSINPRAIYKLIQLTPSSPARSHSSQAQHYNLGPRPPKSLLSFLQRALLSLAPFLRVTLALLLFPETRGTSARRTFWPCTLHTGDPLAASRRETLLCRAQAHVKGWTISRSAKAHVGSR